MRQTTKKPVAIALWRFSKTNPQDTSGLDTKAKSPVTPCKSSSDHSFLAQCTNLPEQFKDSETLMTQVALLLRDVEQETPQSPALLAARFYLFQALEAKPPALQVAEAFQSQAPLEDPYLPVWFDLGTFYEDENKNKQALTIYQRFITNLHLDYFDVVKRYHNLKGDDND